jgi:hypothetical protein
MSRKDINIGLTGNDGTGDSIRDAFGKVNENFRELYASQGLEEGLSFDNLIDVVKPLRPNAILTMDSLGGNVVSRELVALASDTISVDTTTDPSKIILSLTGIQISQDPVPTLSNALNASGFKLSFVGNPTEDQDAATRRWVYANFLNRDDQDLVGAVNSSEGSTMRKNFRIVPTPNNGNPNVGEQRFTVFAADGVTPKEDVFLKFQGAHPAHATRKDYVDTKLSLEGTFAKDPATGLTNRGFGVMTGPLILNDHPSPYVGITKKPDTGETFAQEDYRAATKGYVDAKSYSSPSNIFVSTIGNDDMWDFDNDRPNPAYGYPEQEIGRSWSKAFKSIRQAARFAKKYIDRVSVQNNPYEIVPQQVQRWAPLFADPIASPRTRVRISIQNHGYVDGDYVKVSGAILGSIDTRNLNGIFRVNKLDANNFELNLKSLVNWTQPQVAPGGVITVELVNKKDGPYSTLSRVDFGYRGFFVPKPEITIMIESGVYFEEFPIVIPANVAIRGDEFRRTLIKPKEGPVPSSNQDLVFVRGDRSLGADFWYNSHYYHQLARSVGTTNVAGSSRLEVKSAAYPPKPGMRFAVGTIGGQPNIYRVGSIRNIFYKEPNPDLNIAPGTYIMDIVDDNGDTKLLAQAIPDSATIEFLLDNDHCDQFLVSDAFQARNVTFFGNKGFSMAFDPAGQILTRSPYGQVCATFAGEGGGGQLIDGMAGNQVCYVQDLSYTDPFTGTQGATGTKVTVTGLIRKPQVPNTFYLSKKKYVIIETTDPDVNGTAILTLSSETPIAVDDTFLPAGFIPNGTQILIETAGNRSMLSNDFTMVNDLGYGILAENNGVCEAVSQFTYYCRVGYLARSGGQIRSVGGSSCYGLIGLQSEGSDPNEAIQIGRIKTPVVNLITPLIDDPLADGNLGAVSFLVGGADSKPLRNATFKLNKHEVIIKDIRRARLSGGALTTGPLRVFTYYRHPYKTGDSVQMSSIRGLQLPPISPSTIPRTTDVDGRVYTITVVDAYSFTLNTSESTNYINDLGEYDFVDLPPRAVANLVDNAQEVIYNIKGDPSPANVIGKVRFDGVGGENGINSTILKVYALDKPAVVGMKFSLDSTNPQVANDDQVYKVTAVQAQTITFKAQIREVDPLGINDNKIGATTLYVTDVTSGWEPEAGWSFQLLDTNLGVSLDYTRYTVVGEPSYDAVEDRWALELDKPLTVNMVNQIATAQVTKVDGYWDLTLDRGLKFAIPNISNPVGFVFYDSYWRCNIDPALSNPLPTTLDQYNKPQAKPFNLFQTKTISVAQITNRPAIVNSSAMRFSSTNYDPSIYRILGKTADGGITEDVYQIAEEATPLEGFFVDAVSKLTANKEFIQSETINYLATIYPDFVYNQDICYRDVGFIIDAVVYDLTYGGNVRSRAAGVSYYQQGNPSAALVLSQQRPETIDAIDFATTVAQTVLNQYPGAVLSQDPLPYRGVNLNGVSQLLANKEFIIEDTIAFLTNTYSSFNYNPITCRRDLGYIIDAVAYDLEYSGNVRTRYAALKYYEGSVSAEIVLTQQKPETIAAINHARNIAQLIVLETTVLRQNGNLLTQDTSGTPGVSGVDDLRVGTLMSLITNVIQNGPQAAPARDLGIRRSYQNPLSGTYQGQVINNSIIAESGAGDRVEQLMDQITAIIELGPVNPAGAITSVDIVNVGSGYTTAPTITFSAPNVGSNRATGTVTIIDGSISAVNITNPGGGYTFPPTITISGSNQSAQLSANLSVSLHIIVEPQILDTLQSLIFPANATGLQFEALIEGPGIPQNTFIRTVTQLFSDTGSTLGYRVRISTIINQSIPAGTEISVTGPGSDYLFDLNTDLDPRHIVGDVLGITTTFSTVRATGHDFLQVGAGGFDDSNYPNNVYGQPVNTPSSSAIVREVGTGRVFHVSTDQDGNFRVGSFFNVNQGDGSVTIAAKIGLSAVSSLSFLVGETVNQFSADTKLDDNSDNIVSTQKAIKTYIANIINGRFTVDNTETPQKGLLRLDGASVMKGALNLGLNSIENLRNSEEADGGGGVNRKYVDNVFAGGIINYGGSFEIETTGKRTDVLGFTMISDVTNSAGVELNRGSISLNGNKITNLKSPTLLTDGANKGYVDQAIATGGVRTGWSGFTLNNTTVRNLVSSVTVTNNGSGYTTEPVVVFSSSSGVGASARAILTAGTGARSIASIVVDYGGYGYTTAPTVIIGGSVSTANVTFGGQGYSATPLLTFSDPQIVGGITATGYAVMEGTGINQRILNVVITNAGAGYTSAPTITQTYVGGNPTAPANIVTSLQAGSGAIATAILAPTQRNIDLNGNKVTGSADPTGATDLVNWRYFDSKNFIGENNDVAITGAPQSGDLLVFTGEIPAGSKGSMVNASISANSDITLVRSANTVTISYKPGSISNEDIALNAGISQTKLTLNRAGVVGNDQTPAPSDYGIVSFLDSQFSSNSGFVQLRSSTSKTDGVTLDRIQQITNFRVLGRNVGSEGDTSTGPVQELSRTNLQAFLGLAPETVAVLISDDTLGGLQSPPSGQTEDSATGRTPSGLAPRVDGTQSLGALLKRGGRMQGRVTFASALPAGDVNITPMLAVAEDNKFDIGTNSNRWRNVYSANYFGTNFEGTTFGASIAPTAVNTGAVFNGTATYAQNVGSGGLSSSLQSGTDIRMFVGATNTSFNGSQNVTIEVTSSTEANNSNIAKRSNGTLRATTFEGALSGNATSASNINSGGTNYLGSTGATATTTALRNGSGDLFAVVFRGTASSAQYADLAENYLADKTYDVGTVLEFGGEFEVTEAEDETRRVAGVVSGKPAYLMNSGLTGDNVVAIALQGRVPVKVRGKIRKGDMLVSAGGGYARPTNDPKIGTIIGKALENFDGVEGVIEVVVGRL